MGTPVNSNLDMVVDTIHGRILMKLEEAIKLGKDCGLETVEECIRNIELHAISLFKYEDINKELNELHNDWKAQYRRGNP